MEPIQSREYRLRRHVVTGMPTADDFEVVARPLPALGPGEIRVRNLFLSVDPYMRGRMTGVRTYVPPFERDKAMDGGAVGRIEESNHPDFAVGDLVSSSFGWREGFVGNGKGVLKIDSTIAPPQAYLGVLGMPGMTAYVGLFTIGALAAGETVLVSGAGGAVGMVVCQLAKAHGCRVIASAGTDEKVRWLEEEAKVDVAINYKTVSSLRKAILASVGEGVDLTFENVGGDHFEAALTAAKPFSRLVLCGLISRYNATEAGPGPRNIADVLTKRMTVRGFIVSDHGDRRAEFLEAMRALVKAGEIRWTETIVDGFERMPEAFFGLFSGSNIGKMIVRL